MLNTRYVFVDIDTQRDFLEEDGALYVPGAIEIVGNLKRLIEYARERAIPILATACAHRLNDPDPEPFPPHCLVGARGQERIDETRCETSVVVGPNDRFEGNEPPKHLTLEKEHYDVFTHADADRIVRTYRADGEPTFVVFGVATDYCVRAAVLGLLERGCRVEVVADAVRAVDSEREGEVFTELVERGASLTVTEVVLGR